MDSVKAQSILQPIHEIEQREGRFIRRKELHSHLPEGLSFEDKRVLIQAWQESYFKRLPNIGFFRDDWGIDT